MNDSEMEENEELQDALEQVDEMVDGIGTIIKQIACANYSSMCTTCHRTAKGLYRIFCNYAREEDCDRIRDEYKDITGRDLDE